MTKFFGTSGIRDKGNTLAPPQLTLQVGQAINTYAKAKTGKTAEAIVKKAVKLIDKLIKETSQ